MKSKILQFTIYLIGGLVFGFCTLQLLMWAVWGAPTHPIQYIAFFSSIGLLVAAFCSLFNQNAGRIVGIISVIGIGILIVPSSASLVPSHNINVSLFSYSIDIGYFLLLGFLLYVPKKIAGAFFLLTISLITSIGFAGHTYYNRKQSGEYLWPTFSYYITEGDSDLHIDGTRYGFINSEDIAELRNRGLRGKLVFRGGDTEKQEGNTSVIVVCTQQITDSKALHFPRHGTIIYVYTDSGWFTIPKDIETFDRHVILQTDGMASQELAVGGIQSFGVYHWKADEN